LVHASRIEFYSSAWILSVLKIIIIGYEYDMVGVDLVFSPKEYSCTRLADEADKVCLFIHRGLIGGL
jgi:hypothetical protein